MTGLTQDADGVTLTLTEGRTERADYVVGADGAHSAVRRLLAVGFSGRSYDIRILLADLRFEDGRLPAAVNAFMGRDGALLLPPFGWHRAIIWDRTRQDLPPDVPLGLEEVRDAIHRIAGEDLTPWRCAGPPGS